MGNGPIDAFVRALGTTKLPKFQVLSYSEHSLGQGAEARAVSYIQIKTDRGHSLFGAGIDTNIELASIKADRQRPQSRSEKVAPRPSFPPPRGDPRPAPHSRGAFFSPLAAFSIIARNTFMFSFAPA
jgi:hypothetical protein